MTLPSPAVDALELDIKLLAQKIRRNFQTQRAGQALMNALADLNFALYQRIAGTEADCFYEDRSIESFWTAVRAAAPAPGPDSSPKETTDA